MELHPLARGFADVAEDYERGRPGYPAGAIAAIGLAPGARVADVGAGTGKLTRALVDFGLSVVAVEPFAAMRARLAAELPAVEVLDGTAEALPLADASVDGVTCGDSFHWFDVERAGPELARVLRPGGVLAICGNVPDATEPDEPWARELGDLLTAARPHHPGLDDDGSLYARLDATEAFTPLALVEVPHIHRTDRAGMVASIASMSFVGVLPEDEKTALLARADALLAEHGVEAIELPMKTTVRTARRRG
jgi:SAM-dependent methyltransferase